MQSIPRPSPALIVAVIALVAAMSGAAVALPGENTVKSNDIKKQAVHKSDIERGAVTSAKIRNEGVRATDLATGSVNLSKLGIFPVTRYVEQPVPDDGTPTQAVATCQAGEQLIAGGASLGRPDPGTFEPDLRLLSSRPAGPQGQLLENGSPLGGAGWRAAAINDPGGGTGTGATIFAFAICLRDAAAR